MKKAPDYLTQIIGAAPLPEVAVVIDRLKKLPEYGMSEEHERLVSLLRQAEAAEKAAQVAREAYRNAAMKIYHRVKKDWSPEEIAEATGY